MSFLFLMVSKSEPAFEKSLNDSKIHKENCDNDIVPLRKTSENLILLRLIKIKNLL
jgi:hypothetical protein